MGHCKAPVYGDASGCVKGKVRNCKSDDEVTRRPVKCPVRLADIYYSMKVASLCGLEGMTTVAKIRQLTDAVRCCNAANRQLHTNLP